MSQVTNKSCTQNHLTAIALVKTYELITIYKLYINTPVGYQHTSSFTQDCAIYLSINILINYNEQVLHRHIC